MTDRPRPTGIPIGRALDIPAGIAYDDLREVVAAIDRVHGDGNLPRIPVRLTRGVADFGRFRFDPDTGQPISISINPVQPHRELALLHEIGHFLDWQSLGDGRDFGSMVSPLFEHWAHAIERSSAFRELGEIVRRGTASVHGDSAPAQLLTGDELATLRVFRLPEEYWARSYAQYIATKVPLPSLNRSLDAFLRRLPGRLYYPIHWDVDDFHSILVAIDELFERLEWRT